MARLLRGRSLDPLLFLGSLAGVPGVGVRSRLALALAGAPRSGRMNWWRSSYWRRSTLACLLQHGLPRPGSGWALSVLPDEASLLLPGWPAGQSAVVCTGPSGRVRWGACHQGGEKDLAAGSPLWPPTDGEAACFRPEAEHEHALLVALAGEPGLARRAAAVEAPTMAVDDLDW